MVQTVTAVSVRAKLSEMSKGRLREQCKQQKRQGQKGARQEEQVIERECGWMPLA